MVTEIKGKVIKGLGGLYTVRESGTDDARFYTARAKGVLHRDEEKLLVGDDVVVTVDDSVPDGVIISELLPRKNALIRPPVSNIDYLFIVFAAKKPTPVLEVVDKLTAIAIHNSITPVIIITKSDLSATLAEEYRAIYSGAGFDTFVVSSESGDGVGAVEEYMRSALSGGKTGAFAGASGVGKSTLMNALFPHLLLNTGDVSKKIERGKHTTRHVEIFDAFTGGFIADTPGFSLVDFARFDFFVLDELFATFPDIIPYAAGCTYSDCSHVGEGADECAVARAAKEGKIAESRLESYRSVWRTLKAKSGY